MMITLTAHYQWEDETMRERTGHPPLYAMAKKMKSLTLHTHGCLRAWLKVWSSSSCVKYINTSVINIDCRQATHINSPPSLLVKRKFDQITTHFRSPSVHFRLRRFPRHVTACGVAWLCTSGRQDPGCSPAEWAQMSPTAFRRPRTIFVTAADIENLWTVAVQRALTSSYWVYLDDAIAVANDEMFEISSGEALWLVMWLGSRNLFLSDSCFDTAPHTSQAKNRLIEVEIRTRLTQPQLRS